MPKSHLEDLIQDDNEFLEGYFDLGDPIGIADADRFVFVDNETPWDEVDLILGEVPFDPALLLEDWYG